jgi:membrane protein DedA with SNARE-associated domain
MNIKHLLDGVSPLTIYLLVFGLVMIESLGVPAPGEIALISAALLAASHDANVFLVALAAICGAIIGDSIGFAIGHRYGRNVFLILGRRFPKHFGEAQLGAAEYAFHRWGFWTVFFGRFVAILRILAGPMAGTLRMKYPRFLLANVCGAIAWASLVTAIIYLLGSAAERWVTDAQWVLLLVAALFGVAVMLFFRRETQRLVEESQLHRAEETLAPPEDDQPVSLHHLQ